MGGNALMHAGARRVDRKTALDMIEVVHDALDTIASECGAYLDCRSIPAYHEKADFGDLDFVVDNRFCIDVPRYRLIQALERYFDYPVPYHVTGSTLSVGIPILGQSGLLQVDLIFTPPESVQAAVAYYAWNDIGNLVGRIAHKLGFKYGHDGLWVILRDGTHQFAEISVTRDMDEILSFLGYNPAIWRQGFANPEAIYRFVASSPYFNPAIYDLNNRNHIARTRERKRAIYMGFLEWLKRVELETPRYVYPENKLDNLPLLFKAFPHVEAIYKAKWAELEEGKYLKSRFNASLVSRITGRSDKALGEFMRYFKQNHLTELHGIRQMSDVEIERLIESADAELRLSEGAKE